MVRTHVGERFFRSDIGTPIEKSLFELQTPEFAVEVENQVVQVLVNLEPRIDLKNVDVSFPIDQNEISVAVRYDIVGLSFPVQDLEFVLTPTRT